MVTNTPLILFVRRERVSKRKCDSRARIWMTSDLMMSKGIHCCLGGGW